MNTFSSQGDKIRFFFEENAFHPDGTLRPGKEQSINKIGMHCTTSIPVFDDFRGRRNRTIVSNLGIADLCCCSQCTS